MRGMRFGLLAAVLVGGCVSCPIGDNRSANPTAELEGFKARRFRAVPTDRCIRNGVEQGIRCGVKVCVEALYCDCNAEGNPIYSDSLAFGFYPGYYVWPERDQNRAVAMAFASPIATVCLLGIPLVDALLFEPFLEPTLGDNVFRYASPLGFCKYRAYSRQPRRLTGYSLEYDGVRYDADEKGFVALPRKYVDEKDAFQVKVVPNPRCQRLNPQQVSAELAELYGTMLTVTDE